MNTELKTHEIAAPASSMVRIPPGDFLMGSDDGEAEGPRHMVYLDEFWMDRTPVTNREFAQFVDATGYLTTELRGKRRARPATE